MGSVCSISQRKRAKIEMHRVKGKITP